MDSRQCEISDVNVFVRTKKNSVTRQMNIMSYNIIVVTYIFNIVQIQTIHTFLTWFYKNLTY